MEVRRRHRCRRLGHRACRGRRARRPRHHPVGPLTRDCRGHHARARESRLPPRRATAGRIDGHQRSVAAGRVRSAAHRHSGAGHAKCAQRALRHRRFDPRHYLRQGYRARQRSVHEPGAGRSLPGARALCAVGTEFRRGCGGRTAHRRDTGRARVRGCPRIGRRHQPRHLPHLCLQRHSRGGDGRGGEERAGHRLRHFRWQAFGRSRPAPPS